MKIKYTITTEIDEFKYPNLSKTEIRQELTSTIDSYIMGQCIKETETLLADINAERDYKNIKVKSNEQINTKVNTRRKRYNHEAETCGTCKHWKVKNDGWYGACPILKHDTESDESCNNYEDIE